MIEVKEDRIKLPKRFYSENKEGFTMIINPEGNAIAQFPDCLDLSQDRFQKVIDEKIQESQMIFSRKSAQ